MGLGVKVKNFGQSLVYIHVIYIVPLEWSCKIPESIHGSEIVKVCVIFEEKWCSGSNSKFCYYVPIELHFESLINKDKIT